jgi:hypothetical protein
MIQTIAALIIFAVTAVPVSELDADPANWNGRDVTVTGEIIGDYSLRDDVVWFQLNDDAYASSPLGESQKLEGGNIGIGVRILRSDWSSAWGAPGRYGQRGPIVELTGRFRHNSPDDQGETFIEGSEIRLVEAARPIENPPIPVGRAIVGGLLAFAGLTLYWLGRRPQYRRV